MQPADKTSASVPTYLKPLKMALGRITMEHWCKTFIMINTGCGIYSATNLWLHSQYLTYLMDSWMPAHATENEECFSFSLLYHQVLPLCNNVAVLYEFNSFEDNSVVHHES